MKRVGIFGALVFLAGCGGSGGPDSFAIPTNGHFAGSYSNPDTGERLGAAEVAVSGNVVTGTLGTAGSGTESVINGAFSNLGDFEGTYKTGGINGNFVGTTKEQNHKLFLSTFAVTQGDVRFNISIRATREN